MSAATVLHQDFSPVEHYDYSILDVACSCVICMQWRQLYTTIQNSGVANHHRGCACSICIPLRKTRSAFLAAVHRRDLYCESSFHAAHMEPPELGTSYMSWLKDVLLDRKTRSDSWWEFHGERYPIAYWMRLFRQDLGGDALGFDIDLTLAMNPDLPIHCLETLSLNVSGMGTLGLHTILVSGVA